MNNANSTPLFTITGPDNTNVEQKVNVVTETESGKQHTFLFYDNYAGESFPSITDWGATCIAVEGVGIASISHTLERVGQEFGYNTNGSTVPEYFGTLQDCKEITLTKL
jgi:hypothetical protein